MKKKIYRGFKSEFVKERIKIPEFRGTKFVREWLYIILQITIYLGISKSVNICYILLANASCIIQYYLPHGTSSIEGIKSHPNKVLVALNMYSVVAKVTPSAHTTRLNIS